jgi:hypothetical protein
MKILLGLNGSIHSREFHPDGLDYFRLKKPGWTQACLGRKGSIKFCGNGIAIQKIVK